MGCTNNHSSQSVYELEQEIVKFEESILSSDLSFIDVIASISIKITIEGDELKMDRALKLLGADEKNIIKHLLEHEFFSTYKIKQKKSLATFMRMSTKSNKQQEEKKIDFYKVKLLIFLLLSAHNEKLEDGIIINHKAEYFYNITKDYYKGDIFRKQEDVESVQRFNIHLSEVLQDLINLACIVIPTIYRETRLITKDEEVYFDSLKNNYKKIYDKVIEQIFKDKEEIFLKDIYKLFEDENVYFIKLVFKV